ncbi:type II toxin-antitoxin system RelE/ParE family toxin [Fangia hongkongensis]|uniref:type II toxin-antitoxin system RelE/ParE family toxin n=2 Tax=Fangia hongkongensis TaxID=270495 RepID=UPI0003677904|nr:type II toxin-antitoxin system RelE/ParE family toxin [Fangia hongkongensis]
MSWITIVETPVFLKITEKFCERDIVDEMIEIISQNPEVGDIIPNTGGCRKLRWQRNRSSGKSGGIRTIYYFYDSTMPIYLLLAYPKSVADNINAETANTLKTIVKQMVKNHKNLRGK